MRNITNELINEHRNILRVIALTLNECDKMEAGSPINKQLMADVVLFIQKYADGFHHAKEEDILFTAMLENQDCMHCNPIPVMLSEHDEGRAYLKALVEANEQNDVEALIVSARGYCFLLAQHIHKEDNVLYPMAEDALNENQKSQVEDKYAKVDVHSFIEKDIIAFIETLEEKVY